MKHTYYKCDGKHYEDDYYQTYCQFCDGGLATCTVCGGAEGTLTTDCVGTPVPEEVLVNLVWQGPWDYVDGKWILKNRERAMLQLPDDWSGLVDIEIVIP